MYAGKDHHRDQRGLQRKMRSFQTNALCPFVSFVVKSPATKDTKEQEGKAYVAILIANASTAIPTTMR